MTVQWAKVKGASKYEVYATYCGSSFSNKPIATISGSKAKVTIKKLNGKKLDQTKNVKVYVNALSSSSGKTIKAKSIVAHIVGVNSKKYTNVKAINLGTKSLSIKKGTCNVYVYAKNGYAKKVKVTVK